MRYVRSTSMGNIRLLGVFNFLDDFRLFGPILIIYFADVSGSFALAGAVLATTMVASALFEVPTGVLSDRLPRKHVATMGAVAMTAAVATYAVAPGFEVLIIGAVLEGLSRSLFSGNNDALLWDSLAEHGRESEFHHHSGRVSACFQVALATSAVVGGFVAGWSMQWAVALSVIPQALSIVITLLLREPEVHHDVAVQPPLRQIVESTRYIFRHRELRRLTLANAVVHGAGESGWQFQPAFVAGLWPTWAIGLGRGANHALSFSGFWWAGKIIDRFGPTRTLLGSSVVADVVGLIAFGKPTVVSPMITPVEGAMYGMSTTAKSLMLQRLFTDSERATMGSIGGFLGSICFGLCSVLAGVIADAHGPAAALLTCHVIGMSATPVYWRLHRMSRADVVTEGSG